ncbi:MAG: hypothetical protein OEV28_07860 [Nitrospirota bacterium]|nr:hypothetical protein [Nitrospirota bacterium]
MKTQNGSLQNSLSQYTAQVREAFGDALVSLIIYGSAAGDAYLPDQSDVNIMLVLTDSGVNRLRQYAPIYKQWRGRRFSAPLLVTQEYLRTSADVFPMEFLDIKERHRLLFGEDIMSGLQIGRSNLRYQCEEQVKGQLVRLRGALIETQLQKEPSEKVLAMALSSLMPTFRAILRLLGQECPGENDGVIHRLCAVMEVRGDAFIAVGRLKAGEKGSSPVTDLVDDFLTTLEQLAGKLDYLKASGSI